MIHIIVVAFTLSTGAYASKTPSMASATKAAPAKKAAKTEIPETFSAIDASSPVMMDQFVAQHMSPKQKPKDPTSQFEVIPPEHTDSIIARLQIVEEIVQEFGRAYDYRVHTTAELQAILNQLQALKSPAAEEVSPAGFAAPNIDI